MKKALGIAAAALALGTALAGCGKNPEESKPAAAPAPAVQAAQPAAAPAAVAPASANAAAPTVAPAANAAVPGAMPPEIAKLFNPPEKPVLDVAPVGMSKE